MTDNMKLSQALALASALLAGALLGAVFFGGLWWTVRKCVSSNYPALWVFTSLILRMGILLPGIYFIGSSHWDRMLLCLLGFVMARVTITKRTRPRTYNLPTVATGASHAT